MFLQDAQDAVLLDRVARARQACLDELYRRHPRQFDAWLQAGARAASDPGRYLLSSPAAGRRRGLGPGGSKT